jgi:hypothetical protein
MMWGTGAIQIITQLYRSKEQSVLAIQYRVLTGASGVFSELSNRTKRRPHG